MGTAPSPICLYGSLLLSLLHLRLRLHLSLHRHRFYPHLPDVVHRGLVHRRRDLFLFLLLLLLLLLRSSCARNLSQ